MQELEIRLPQGSLWFNQSTGKFRSDPGIVQAVVNEANYMAQDYVLRGGGGPSRGEAGYELCTLVATRLKGRAILPPPPPGSQEVVF